MRLRKLVEIAKELFVTPGIGDENMSCFARSDVGETMDDPTRRVNTSARFGDFCFIADEISQFSL
jgi:hypothetical protein